MKDEQESLIRLALILRAGTIDRLYFRRYEYFSIDGFNFLTGFGRVRSQALGLFR